MNMVNPTPIDWTWSVVVVGIPMYVLRAPLCSKDALPQEVRESRVLTGNDLAQLGALLEMPNETDVNDFKLLELSELFIEHEGDGVALEHAVHKFAADCIASGEVENALKAVMAFNLG